MPRWSPWGAVFIGDARGPGSRLHPIGCPRCPGHGSHCPRSLPLTACAALAFQADALLTLLFPIRAQCPAAVSVRRGPGTPRPGRGWETGTLLTLSWGLVLEFLPPPWALRSRCDGSSSRPTLTSKGRNPRGPRGHRPSHGPSATLAGVALPPVPSWHVCTCAARLPEPRPA